MSIYKNIYGVIIFAIIGNSVCGQNHRTLIKFNSPCFKKTNISYKNIGNNLIQGYDCEFVFVPDVSSLSDKTGKIYYKDWWNLFVAKQDNFIDIYPLQQTIDKAHVCINRLSDSAKVLYSGIINTINLRDFNTKYNTDDWQIDTLRQMVNIINKGTFKYKDEFITIINVEDWNLFVPNKCKIREGYSLVYSNQRGFVGSCIYFFSKENGNKPTSYHFIGDQKLCQFLNRKHIIYYFGPGIWWECDK